MNKTCRRQGHQWRLDYPAEESEWVKDPLKIWVCRICGAVKSEGTHKKINSELKGAVHDQHLKMARTGL